GRACGTSSCRPGPCGRGSSGCRRRGPSAPRASRAGRARRPRSGVCAATWPSVRWLHRVEPALPVLDVLPGAGELVAVDLGVGAGSVDLLHAVRAGEVEAALLDRERVAVEAAHGRAGGAVAFEVVGTTVAGAAEAGEPVDRRERVAAVVSLDVLRRAAVHEPVRLHRAAEVRAAVRDDREARQLAE